MRSQCTPGATSAVAPGAGGSAKGYSGAAMNATRIPEPYHACREGTLGVFDRRTGLRVRRHAAGDPLLRRPGPARAAARRPAAHLLAARPHAPEAHAARQAPRPLALRDPRAGRHVRARARRAAAAQALPRGAGGAPGEPAPAARRHRGAAVRARGLREEDPQAARPQLTFT